MGLSADTYTIQDKTKAVVLAALETKIETIGTGHVIYHISLVLEGHDWHGNMIYEP